MAESSSAETFRSRTETESGAETQSADGVSNATSGETPRNSTSQTGVSAGGESTVTLETVTGGEAPPREIKNNFSVPKVKHVFCCGISTNLEFGEVLERNFYPCDTQIKRFPLTHPEKQQPWQEPFEGYDPTFYDKDQDDLEALFKSNIEKPTYNVHELRSFHGEYFVTPDAIPLNIMGRTGVVGRGVLNRLGPNKKIHFLLTTWTKNRDEARPGILVHKNTYKPVLSLLTYRDFILEYDFDGPANIWVEALFSQLRRNYSKKDINTVAALLANYKIVYRGYLDDPRNTDNAWIETQAVHVNDEDGSLINCLGQMYKKDDWDNVIFDMVQIGVNNSSRKLPEFQRVLARQVIKFHDAHADADW